MGSSSPIGPRELDREFIRPHFQGAEVYRVRLEDGERPQYYIKLNRFVGGGYDQFLSDADFWGVEGDFYQLESEGAATTGMGQGIVEGVESLAREGHREFEILYAEGSAIVNCGGGTVKRLEELHPNAAQALLSRARFFARPEVDVPTYLSTLPDGRYILITSPNSMQDYYEKFRAFIGMPGHMRELRITNVTRYRDGGTTYVETEGGTFYYPSPFISGRRISPTFTSAATGQGAGRAITMTALDPRDKDKGVIGTLKVPLKNGSPESNRFLCDPTSP